jgi:hypothetical protein
MKTSYTFLIACLNEIINAERSTVHDESLSFDLAMDELKETITSEAELDILSHLYTLIDQYCFNIEHGESFMSEWYTTHQASEDIKTFIHFLSDDNLVEITTIPQLFDRISSISET